MGGFLLLLLVIGLTISLAFSIHQILELRARLKRYSEISNLERKKQSLAADIKESTDQLAQQRAAHQRESAEIARKLAAHRAELAQSEARLGSFRELDELTRRNAELKAEVQAGEAAIGSFREAAQIARRIAELRAELQSVEESIEVQSFGLYRPRYAYVSSSDYKTKLDEVWQRQKSLVKEEEAWVCTQEWTVDGNKAKGKKMVAEQAKLMLRAFNGESDAAIAKVKYNNAVTLENRVQKAFEAINKLGQTKSLSLTDAYLQTKLDELRLTHELQEKLQAEKDAQREIKEQMREEERAQREIEEAQAKAEREEGMQQAALEKARAELAESAGKQTEKLAQLVSKLELELKDAIDRKAKAIARAQLTKSGHVYVISNIGSFGEGCFKIGMTRRLDPMERVWELGDASVPFEFDVHAMIFSENAPELEGALHRELAECRVNRINTRKEFFRVTLDRIQAAVERNHGVITFVTVPEAEDYRKSIALERELAARAAQLPVA